MQKEQPIHSRLKLLAEAGGLDSADILEYFLLEYKANPEKSEDSILSSSRDFLKFLRMRESDADHQLRFSNDLGYLSSLLAQEYFQDPEVTYEKLQSFFLSIAMLPRTSLPVIVFSMYGSLLFPELFCESLLSFPVWEKKSVDDCVRAERLFLQWIFDRSAFKPYGRKVNIITDENNQPLFLEKRHFINSALTLQDIVVNEMLIPAGTLVSLSRSKAQSTAYFERNKSQSGHIVPLDQSDINGVTPLRFSLFIVDGQERENYFFRQITSYEEYAKQGVLAGSLTLNITDVVAICSREI